MEKSQNLPTQLDSPPMINIRGRTRYISVIVPRSLSKGIFNFVPDVQASCYLEEAIWFAYNAAE